MTIEAPVVENQLSNYVSMLRPEQIPELVTWVESLNKISAPVSLLDRAILRFKGLFNRKSGAQENLQSRALSRVFESLREAQSTSFKDALTGIPNRRAFDGGLSQVISRVKRQHEDFDRALKEKPEQLPPKPGRYAVMLFDLNEFKSINDTYGHAAGDAAIKAFAAKLHSIVRKDEICARTGGDEFAVILFDATHQEDFPEIAREHFVTALAGLTFEYDGKTYPLPSSIGITEIFPGKTSDEVYKAADANMYLDKLASKAARNNSVPMLVVA
jgi:diguanylate cyclase (GGDEF)-like protein